VRIPCRVCDQKTQAQFWLSILFLLFSFLNFRFMFSNFDLNLYYSSWINASFSQISNLMLLVLTLLSLLNCFIKFLMFIVVWEIDQFLACFEFWVKNWNVKLETGNLGFDLVVCNHEKVAPIKKLLIKQSHGYWTWIESRTFEKLWLIRFRHFTSPWNRIVKLQLSVLKRPLDEKELDWQFGLGIC